MYMYIACTALTCTVPYMYSDHHPSFCSYGTVLGLLSLTPAFPSHRSSFPSGSEGPVPAEPQGDPGGGMLYHGGGPPHPADCAHLSPGNTPPHTARGLSSCIQSACGLYRLCGVHDDVNPHSEPFLRHIFK